MLTFRTFLDFCVIDHKKTIYTNFQKQLLQLANSHPALFRFGARGHAVPWVRLLSRLHCLLGSLALPRRICLFLRFWTFPFSCLPAWHPRGIFWPWPYPCLLFVCATLSLPMLGTQDTSWPPWGTCGSITCYTEGDPLRSQCRPIHVNVCAGLASGSVFRQSMPFVAPLSPCVLPEV